MPRRRAMDGFAVNAGVSAGQRRNVDRVRPTVDGIDFKDPLQSPGTAFPDDSGRLDTAGWATGRAGLTVHLVHPVAKPS